LSKYEVRLGMVTTWDAQSCWKSIL